MDQHVIDWTLARMRPMDFAGARMLLDSYQAAGWISEAEAAEWRRRMVAWEEFQHSSQKHNPWHSAEGFL